MSKNRRLVAPLLIIMLLGLASISALSQQSSRTGKMSVQIPLPVLASNGPVPLIDLAKLVRAADVIAVGQVMEVSDEGRASVQTQEQNSQRGSVHEVVASLRLDRVLSGQTKGADISVRFLVPEAPNGAAAYSEIEIGKRGVFFLSVNTTPEGYSFADPYYPMVVAAADAPPVGAGSTLFDQVVAEVTHVLTSPSASEAERMQAIRALEFVKTRTAIMALRRAAKDSDTKLRLQAMAALLRHNDTTVLDQVVDTLLNPPSDVPKYLVDGLGYSIRAGIKDPQAIPALVRLLDSPEAEKRRIAIIALGQTRSQAAAASLTKALDDPDQEVRYNAVVGLAQVTGETDGMPSLEFFKRNEERYLTHWRGRMRKK